MPGKSQEKIAKSEGASLNCDNINHIGLSWLVGNASSHAEQSISAARSSQDPIIYARPRVFSVFHFLTPTSVKLLGRGCKRNMRTTDCWKRIISARQFANTHSSGYRLNQLYKIWTGLSGLYFSRMRCNVLNNLLRMWTTLQVVTLCAEWKAKLDVGRFFFNLAVSGLCGSSLWIPDSMLSRSNRSRSA